MLKREPNATIVPIPSDMDEISSDPGKNSAISPQSISLSRIKRLKF